MARSMSRANVLQPVRLDLTGLVGSPETAHVDRDRSVAGGSESRQLVAPRVPELRESVEQHDRRTLAGLDIVELNAAIDLDAAFAKTELLRQ